VLGEQAIGYIEVEIFDEGERLPRHGGWADVGNLHVIEQFQRRGIGTWLFGQAAEWLELANVDRLLDYAYQEDQDETGQRYDGYRALLAACGFRELTRTRRGRTRPAGQVSAG
jgi:GNAT superfamily N-acetyltransferase